MDCYSVVKQIGKGSYGEVWLTRSKIDKKRYVLKKVDVSKAPKRERKAAQLEVQILASLKHPNIVSYKDSFVSSDGAIYIIMGFCEGGDLYRLIKECRGVPLDEIIVVEWFIQIAMALQYIHGQNILHRDLKTQNIFLTKNKIIKIGDFGIARVLNTTCDMATTLIGTPYYMSPEIFTNKPYNHKSDVWALGCCLYEMTSLRHAFNARDMNSLMYKILKGKPPPMPKRYSPELLDLMKSMLNYNPDLRPSVSTILNNSYIRKNITDFLNETKKSVNEFPSFVTDASSVHPSSISKRDAKKQSFPSNQNDSESVNVFKSHRSVNADERRSNQCISKPNKIFKEVKNEDNSLLLIPYTEDNMRLNHSVSKPPIKYIKKDILKPKIGQCEKKDNANIRHSARDRRRRIKELCTPREALVVENVNHEGTIASNHVMKDAKYQEKVTGKPPRPLPELPNSNKASSNRYERVYKRSNAESKNVVGGNGESFASKLLDQNYQCNKSARQRRREKLKQQQGLINDVPISRPKSAPELRIDKSNNSDEVDAKINNEDDCKSDEMDDLITALDRTLNLHDNCNVIKSTDEGGEMMESSLRIENRTKTLRKDCLEGIGTILLKEAYRVLDLYEEEKQQNKMIELLGEDRYNEFVGKIWQLKFCENLLSEAKKSK